MKTAKIVRTCAFAGFVFCAILPFSNRLLRPPDSLVLYGQEGSILGEFREEDRGSYQEWVEPGRFPRILRRAVIESEDRRFFAHPGVDPLSLLRAFYQNIKERRITSGASTITQQTARLTLAHLFPERLPLVRKILEVVVAVKLELQFSKQEILHAYLNLVPLRTNRRGYAAASRESLGRDVQYMGVAEASALAVLARQSRVNDSDFARRHEDLLTRLGASEKDRTAGERVRTLILNKHPVKEESDPPAPHFADFLRSRFPGLYGNVRTPIPENLNASISSIVRRELDVIRGDGAEHAAVVVIELPSLGEHFVLRALIGSPDYKNADAGQVNGALAVRDAGSTLKPLLYALAMDQGLITPNSIIDDSDLTMSTGVQGEMYRPRNNDMHFWGPLTVREALAGSRNIPAARMVRRLGEPVFYKFLQRAGFSHLDGGPERYGPGLALGAAGVTLLELTQAFAMLSAGGRSHPIFVGTSGDKRLLLGRSDDLLSQKNSLRVRHVISDRTARIRSFGARNFLDFPFDVAAKTGTSKDYRDSWTVGFTDRYAVGVWVGNFSGRPMRGVSGAWGAGRIFQQVMRRLGPHNAKFHYPDDWREKNLCRFTGLLAGPRCQSYVEIFPPDEHTPEPCSGTHDKPGSRELIASPKPGEIFLIDPHTPLSAQAVPFTFNCPKGSECSWRLDDGEIRKGIPGPLALKPGRHKLAVIVDGQESGSVSFQVK